MTRRARTRALLLLTLLLVALVGSGCSGGDAYRVHASFPRATALFEGSRVKVMGLDVGTVERIELAGDEIDVTLLIDGDIPLPQDVHASIVALTLIGERNVVLEPPFSPGATAIGDGHVIPDENTRVAAEPDDILESIVGLVDSLDPERVNAVLTDAAAAVEGQGETINRAFEQAARISAILREQDERIIAAAEGVTELSATLNRREAELVQLLDAFAGASDVLVEHREGAQVLLGNLVELNREADNLVGLVEDTLPDDLGLLALLLLTVEENTDSLIQTIELLPDVTGNLLGIHNEEMQSLTVRANFTEANE